MSVFQNKDDKLQSLAIEVLEKEKECNELEIEADKAIQALQVYQTYQEKKNELEQFKEKFNETAIKLLKKNGVTTSEGIAGRITLVQRKTYNVIDEEALPEEYKELPELEKKVKVLKKNMKNDVELFGLEIPGVEQKISEYILFTPREK